jgi:hypothetical protein
VIVSTPQPANGASDSDPVDLPPVDNGAAADASLSADNPPTPVVVVSPDNPVGILPDLAVTDSTTNTVSPAPTDGQAETPPVDNQTITSVIDTSTATLTVDSVIADTHDDTTSLTAGNGNDTLVPPAVPPSGDGSQNSTGTDLVTDTQGDLGVANSANTDLLVLLVTDKGTPTPPEPVPPGSPGLLIGGVYSGDSSTIDQTGVKAVDHTNSTHDNNAADTSATVQTLLVHQDTGNSQDDPGSSLAGNSADTSGSPIVLPTGEAGKTTTADPDTLGRTDLAVSRSADNDRFAHRGDEHRTIPSSQHGLPGDSGTSSVTDSAESGGTDPAVANTGERLSSTPENNTVGGSATGQNLTTSQGPDTLNLAGLLGNGRSDFLSSGSGDNTSSAFLNGGYGALLPLPTLGVGGRLDSVGGGDLAGNEQLDLITIGFRDNAVEILLGNSEGSFLPDSVAVSSPLANTGSTALTLLVTLVAGFNRDNDAGSPELRGEAEPHLVTPGEETTASGVLASARDQDAGEDTLDPASIDWTRIPGSNSGILPEVALRRLKLYHDQHPSTPDAPPEREARHQIEQTQPPVAEEATGTVEDPTIHLFSTDSEFGRFSDRESSDADSLVESPWRTADSTTTGEHLEETCLLAVAAAILIIDPLRMPEGSERRATDFRCRGASSESTDQDN